jgi:hypothetical protein
MQFPEELAVGDISETDTDSHFQRIGWAKCVKLLQDVGTDLLTFARDENRNELSFLWVFEPRTVDVPTMVGVSTQWLVLLRQ